MNWSHLRVFYYVAKLGSMSKAGDYLNLSQSSISRTITQFEHSFKKKLFIRTPYGVTLSSEGEIIYDYSRQIVTLFETVNTSLDENSKDIKGNLKLTTTNALASMWLPYYLPDFLKINPNLELSIIANDEELDLSIREADVAIRPFIPHQSEYIQRYLKTFTLGLYASKEYIKNYGDVKSVENLDNHKLLTFAGNQTHPYGNINWILTLEKPIFSPRKSYMCINLGHALYEMALRGIGIIALSEEYPALQTSNLIRILPDIKGPSVDIYYVYHQTHSKSRYITALADYLEEVLDSKGKKNNESK